MRWRFLLLFFPVVLGAWVPTVEFAGRAGDFRRGGGVELWAPVSQSGSMVCFGQGQGGRYIDEWVGSLGGGYRRLLNGCVGVGANAFFDVARSEVEQTYLQGGAGCELFGARWIARANGYFPGPHKFRQVTFESQLDINTNDILDLFDTVLETALMGGDAEFGYGFCVCGNEAWLFAGAYGYNGSGFEAFVGPRVRAEYRIRDVLDWCGAEVIVAGEYQWDRFHNSQGSAILKVRLPFGRKAGKRQCLNICDRMGDPVRREPAIWALQRRTQSVVRQPARITGGPIFFVTELGTGIGTQADPTNINVAYANALAGDAIVLLPGPNGDTVRMDNAGATAAPYPLLVGSSMAAFGDLSQITLIVQGRPVKIPKLGGATARVNLTTTIPNGNDLIRADGNNEIFNFNLLDGERAILSPAANLIRVRDMQVNSPNSTGIELTGATNSLITGTSFTGPGGRAISITGGSTVTIEQITATGLAANMDGIFFSGTDLTVNTGTGFSLTGPAAGTGAGFNLMNASNVRLNGTAGVPFVITNMGRGVLADTVTDLAIANLNITGSVGNGVELSTINGSFSYTGGAINTSGASGVSIAASPAMMNFTNVNMTTAATGYTMAGTTGNITLTNGILRTLTNQGVVANSLTAGTLTLQSMNINTATTGVEVTKTDGTTATVNINGSAIGNATNGMLIGVDGARTLNVNVTDTGISGIMNGVGGSLLASGTGAVLNNRINQLRVLGLNVDGLLIGSNSATSNGVTVRTLIQNSTFGGPLAVDSIGEKAINLVGTAPGAMPSNFDTTINNCNFRRVLGGNAPEAVIQVLSEGPAGASTVSITGCEFSSIPSRGILATWVGFGQATSINMTVRNNTWEVTGNPNPFVEFDSVSSAGLLCAEVLTNKSATSPVILLSSTGAPSQFQVVAPGLTVGSTITETITAILQDLNTIPANSVTLSPANPPGPARFTVVASCPKPVLPPE